MPIRASCSSPSSACRLVNPAMHPVYALVAFAGASATLAAAAPSQATKPAEQAPTRKYLEATTEINLAESTDTVRRDPLPMWPQRPVPARFRSMEERRLYRRDEAKKKQEQLRHHKQKHKKIHKHKENKNKKKNEGKKAGAKESDDDDWDSGDVDESGEEHEPDESGKDSKLADDTNEGDTNSGDTDDTDSS